MLYANGSNEARDNDVIGGPSYTLFILAPTPNQTSIRLAPVPFVQLAVLPVSGSPVAPFAGLGFVGGLIGHGGPRVIYS